jgi:hypothetical protein
MSKARGKATRPKRPPLVIVPKGKGKGKGKGAVAPTKPTPRPQQTPAPVSVAPVPVGPRPGVIVQGIKSADLEVVACTASSVEVQGPQAGNLTMGAFFIYQESDALGCSACSPLCRYIESVRVSSTATVILSTSFAAAGEILGDRVSRNLSSLWRAALTRV